MAMFMFCPVLVLTSHVQYFSNYIYYIGILLSVIAAGVKGFVYKILNKRLTQN